MNLDEDRDNFGNLRDTSHHTELEAKRAGVLNNDSIAVGQWKVDEQRRRDAALLESGQSSGNGSSTPGDMGVFVGLLALIAGGLLLGVGDSFTKWQRSEQAEVIERRADLYSDFSPIQKWPRAVRDKYEKFQHKPLSDILGDVSKSRKSISSDGKADDGAKIWFSVSSRGKEAHSYAVASFSKALRKGQWVGMEPLVLEFLHQQCKSGVLVACLDAARVRAGAIFETTPRFDAVDGDKKALAELPATGPNADAPEVIELRKRISRGPVLSGWDYLDSLWQKFKSVFG